MCLVAPTELNDRNRNPIIGLDDDYDDFDN